MGSRLRLSVLGAVALVAAGLAVPVAADTASTTSAVPVAGVTTIVGSTTSRIAVQVPPGTTFNARATDIGGKFDNAPNMQVEGDGRLVGYALVREDDEGALTADHAAFRLPVVYADTVQDRVGRSECGGLLDCPLRPGKYWLYLLADGSPVTVTLKFGGLAGATTLQPTQAVPYQYADVRKASFEQGTSPIVRSRALGATRTLASTGLTIGYAYGDFETAGPVPGTTGPTYQSDYGLCTYEQEPAEGYLPYCGASGTLRTRFLSGRVDRPGGFSNTAFAHGVSGTFGYGGFQTTVGQDDTLGLFGIWLGYAPQR